MKYNRENKSMMGSMGASQSRDLGSNLSFLQLIEDSALTIFGNVSVSGCLVSSRWCPLPLLLEVI